MSKIKIIIPFIIIVIVTAGALFYFGQSNMDKKQPATTTVNTVLQQQAQNQIGDLKEKLATDPQNVSLKRELARAYYLMQNLGDAQTLINEVIQIDDTNPQYYVDLGNIYVVQKDFSKAQEVYKKAIDLNTKEIPNSALKDLLPEQVKTFSSEPPSQSYNLPTPYSALADLYLNHLNKTQEAIDVLLEGIKVVPEYPDFYFMLSNAYGKIGDSVNAEKYKKQFDALVSQQKSR